MTGWRESRSPGTPRKASPLPLGGGRPATPAETTPEAGVAGPPERGDGSVPGSAAFPGRHGFGGGPDPAPMGDRWTATTYRALPGDLRPVRAQGLPPGRLVLDQQTVDLRGDSVGVLLGSLVAVWME